MSSINGVDIQKGAVGSSAIPNATSTSAFLIAATEIDGKLLYRTPYSVTSLKQLEDLGITATYDVQNSVVVHRHFKDFYSYPANANAKVYFMLVDKVNTIPSEVIEDTAGIAARKLITAGKGEIKQLGFIYNLANTAAVDTLVDGLNADIRAAILPAQALYNWADSNDRPCNIVLEGRGISATMGSLLNLRAITNGSVVAEANNVSVCIGQDNTYAKSRTGSLSKYAGVGKCLGAIAAAQVNQSIAEVEAFNLSDALKSEWLIGGLSNGKTIEEADAYLFDLNAKGYIFPVTHSGVSGLRWNADHTCTPIIVDEDGNINVHTIYYGRTIDNAAARLKKHFAKYVKKRVNVDAKTGKLPTAVVKQVEAEADTKVFGAMFTEGLISGGKTFVNKDSSVQPPASLLQIKFKIVPTAILDKLQGKVFLNKTINA